MQNIRKTDVKSSNKKCLYFKFNHLSLPQGHQNFGLKWALAKKKMFNRVRNYTYSLIQALVYITLLCRRILGDDMKLLVCVRILVATIFWFYDRGRLERVGIATLRLGWVLTRPISSSLLPEFQEGAFVNKNIRMTAKENAHTAGYINNSKLGNKFVAERHLGFSMKIRRSNVPFVYSDYLLE